MRSGAKRRPVREGAALTLALCVVLGVSAGCATGVTSGDDDDTTGDGGRRDGSGGGDRPPFITDGHQCQSLDDQEGSGTTCGTGDKGTLFDSGAAVTITGNITVMGAEDWYKFTAGDSNTGTCDKFHVTVQLLDNPGEQFTIDVYRGECPPAGEGCGDASRYDWYTDVTFVGDGGVTGGECPCSPPGIDGVECRDDTQDFYVRVRRKDGLPASCDSYTLELSNGKYPGAYP